jgi:hypothetical protein
VTPLTHHMLTHHSTSSSAFTARSLGGDFSAAIVAQV